MHNEKIIPASVGNDVPALALTSKRQENNFLSFFAIFFSFLKEIRN